MKSLTFVAFVVRLLLPDQTTIVILEHTLPGKKIVIINDVSYIECICREPVNSEV